MKITDEQLEGLLDPKMTEYHYDSNATGSVLEEVAMYIEKDKLLVDVSYFRRGVMDAEFMLNDKVVVLSNSQRDLIQSIFETYFAEKESSNAEEYYRAEREQDGDIDYDQFYFIQ